MNIGRLLGKAIAYAKKNPDKVLIVAAALAPGAVKPVLAKVAPLIVPTKAVD